MTTQRSFSRLASAFALGLWLGGVSLAGNLVENGAFEGSAGADGLPTGWAVVGEKSAVSYDADAKCVRLEDPAQEVSIRQPNLSLEPGKQYRLTCQVKTENFEAKGGAGVTIVDEGWNWSCGYLRPEAPTADWTAVEKVFTPAPSANGKYQVVFFSTEGRGRIFAQDIRLEPAD
ncbi:MAG: hypothetical protein A3K19_11380 [Lentisphaerae bacterium RIFOXYB12_FULL_65_16]|nr:MAG: hypothetical protein A3K19_11380 [Lentisphaerae bacterium RIFOXYB12_FULL_65_16]